MWYIYKLDALALHRQLFCAIEDQIATTFSYQNFLEQYHLRITFRMAHTGKAFDFAGEVAIVTGAGSRLAGRTL
jgi:hypothetical protein